MEREYQARMERALRDFDAATRVTSRARLVLDPNDTLGDSVPDDFPAPRERESLLTAKTVRRGPDALRREAMRTSYVGQPTPKLDNEVDDLPVLNLKTNGDKLLSLINLFQT